MPSTDSSHPRAARTVLLAAIAGALAGALGASTIRAASAGADPGAQATVVDHLRVRRLDVVAEDGTARVILAAPLPDPVVRGEQIERSHPVPGIMLRDAAGNEMGGIGVIDREGLRGALMALDYETAEAIGFNLINRRPSFLVIGPPPEGAELGVSGPTRIALGLDDEESPALVLHDAEGRERLRLRVDDDGAPQIEFLDESGAVVERLAAD